MLAQRIPAPPLRACAPAFAVAAACLLVSAPAWGKPILFPATPSGPAEWRDERATAPYLAAWKASRLRMARATGAQGTANQVAYDVRTYDLDLAFDPVAQLVSGTVRTRATVVAGPLSTLELDLLSNMAVDAVACAGVPRTFTRNGDILVLSLDHAYANGELVDVTVTYHGLPAISGPFGGSFGFTTANGRRLIWSLSEPYGARSWWPCKDAPEDKADSVDIRYTVPTGMKTASNGTLVSSSDNGTVAVTRWHERHAIASYLVSIASYPYTQTTDWYRYTATDSMRIDFFNYPESVAGAAPTQAKVKDMISAYATRFGPYPFVDEKYGHAQFNFGGGMEHQTCTSLGSFGEFVVAHELGHQWWGDKVTCRNFHHIWLNEGFATYMEAIWAEANGGPGGYAADLAINKYYGPGTVYVPDTTDAGRIFDAGLSYDKGAWVLHMLRHVVGDSLFFQAMRQYGTQFAYGTAVTEDLRDVFETMSGRDLHAFFQQWVYGEYYPVYRPQWTSAAGGAGWDVTLTLQQVQSWQLFTMPVDVAITTEAGEQRFVVRDSLASQVVTLHVDARPVSLVVDPDQWILRQIDQPVTGPPMIRSVLLVNGVDWSTYGTEITSAYLDRAFSGDYAIDFWDHFPTPAGGYPGTLPAPLGHGPVPADIIGRYRNVIWIGNNFNGDLDSWVQTPILSYLNAGGNVLLMARMGDVFLYGDLLNYAGFSFVQSGVTLQDCLATRPGLGNLTPIAGQTLCAVFDTVRARTDTELLFRAQAGFFNPQPGIGVIREPVGGAGLRPHGGRFAFISGRPYRWDHAQLRGDVSTILAQYFSEPLSQLDAGGATPAIARLALSPPQPNPARGAAALRLSLSAPARVDVQVIDSAGRRIRVLARETLAAGSHSIAWDGRDENAHPAPAGIYWIEARAGSRSAVRKLVRLP